MLSESIASTMFTLQETLAKRNSLGWREITPNENSNLHEGMSSRRNGEFVHQCGRLPFPFLHFFRNNVGVSQHLRKKQYHFHKLFQKIEKDGILLNSLYEACIALISKPDKDIIRKGNYSPMFLNTCTEILSKLWLNGTTQHEWVQFIRGMQGWFNIWKAILVIHHIIKINS